MSIPHTGTIFVSRFLEQVMGVRLVQDYSEFMETDDTNVLLRLHTSNPHQSYKVPIWEYSAKNCKVVAPIRHPHENIVSCVARGHPNLLYPWQNWREMMRTVPIFDEVFWVDVDTEYRENMMGQLCTFIEREPRNLDLYEQYVKDWKKVNRVSKSNEIRKAYNETGVLPHGPKYELFDDAIAWYTNLKQQLDEKYSK
jgi:hypothetical protein